MKIKELHADVERYLLNDCYCPHEIYSFDGFFYQMFYEDQDCVKLGERHVDGNDFVACIALPDHSTEGKAQVLIFYTDSSNSKVVDSIRFDATEANIALTKLIIDIGIQAVKAAGKKFDEYEPGSTAKSLSQILSMCDAVTYN